MHVLLLKFCNPQTYVVRPQIQYINPLNAELNPIRHLLALLGAQLIFHISRIRVKSRAQIRVCDTEVVFDLLNSHDREITFDVHL
jgi:hypothetical protein